MARRPADAAMENVILFRFPRPVSPLLLNKYINVHEFLSFFSKNAFERRFSGSHASQGTLGLVAIDPIHRTGV
jgi:hypothetical protein